MEKLTDQINKIAEDVAFMKGEQSQYLPSIRNMLSNHETRILNQEKTTENIRTKVGIVGAAAGGLMALIVAYFKANIIK